jgi:hypothetical protein
MHSTACWITVYEQCRFSNRKCDKNEVKDIAEKSAVCISIFFLGRCTESSIKLWRPYQIEDTLTEIQTACHMDSEVMLYLAHHGVRHQICSFIIKKKVAFKDWTQSPLSSAHVINSKFKYFYITLSNFFGRRVSITNIQNICYKKRIIAVAWQWIPSTIYQDSVEIIIILLLYVVYCLVCFILP